MYALPTLWPPYDPQPSHATTTQDHILQMKEEHAHTSRTSADSYTLHHAHLISADMMQAQPPMLNCTFPEPLLARESTLLQIEAITSTMTRDTNHQSSKIAAPLLESRVHPHIHPGYADILQPLEDMHVYEEARLEPFSPLKLML
jgi:hypothetical protein